MNDCPQASRLGAYHDDEMPTPYRAQFQRHLEQCPQCARELQRIEAMSGLMNSLPRPEMPPLALARLQRKADAIPFANAGRMLETLAAVAATILLVCVIGLTRNSSSGQSIEPIQAWQTQAMAPQAEDLSPGASEELIAGWMVQDLTARGEHD
jgi:anti-sigma factor RsiW